MKNVIYILATVIAFASCQKQDTSPSEVHIVGKMKDVMWKGELDGKVALDTLNKENLYGLGPLEGLRGELMVFNGKAYLSTVTGNETMDVEETYNVKAPFFGYANIAEWEASALPDSIVSLPQLEIYLNSTTQQHTRPFLFKLKGTVAHADIHVVNLPEGSRVSSPEEAHKGLTRYTISNQKADVLGFFSTEHKAVFTHHDTFMHLHLITDNKLMMGHLDGVSFKPGTITLYLPKS